MHIWRKTQPRYITLLEYFCFSCDFDHSIIAAHLLKDDSLFLKNLQIKDACANGNILLI
jgi:hypothetical protein